MSKRGNQGKNKGAGRWTREDIEWGLELARELDVTLEADDYWEEDEGDEDDDVEQEEERRVREEAERANLLRGQLNLQLRQAIPKDVTAEQLVPGASQADVKDLVTRAGELATQIATSDASTLETLGTAVKAVISGLDGIKSVVSKRLDERKRIEQEAREVLPPAGADTEEADALALTRAGVGTALQTTPLTDDALEAGRQALKAARDEALEIATRVQQRSEEHGRIATEASTITDPECLEDHKESLTRARKELTEALEPPITTKRNTDASKRLAALETLVGEINVELDSLGGLQAVQSLCADAGVDPAKYKDFEDTLGGRAAMATLLKTIPAKRLGALMQSLGGGDAGAKAMRSLLDGFGGAGATEDAAKALGGDDKLAGLVTKGKLDGAKAKELCDGLGAALVGALMQGNDPAHALALHAKLGSDPKPLQDLVKEAGLDGKPAALATLFRKGCDADPAKFEALCKGLATKEDRAALGNLVSGAGLGDQPEMLAELFKTGCGGEPAALAGFGKAVGSAPKGLKALLATGGFAERPELLGQVVKDSRAAASEAAAVAAAKLKPSEIRTPKELSKAGTDAAADQVKALGTSFADAADRKNLAALLGTGGLGSKPEVFSQLLQVGCGGDVTKLKSMSDTYPASNEAELKKLGAVIGKGKLGSKPSLLGHLVKDGCQGNPYSIMGFVTAFSGDQDAQKLAQLIDAGGIGDHPETLGHLYRSGCAGAPVKLKAVQAAFASNPAKLKAMLDSGGMATKPDTLGQVLGTGLGGDATKLKTLQNTFDGASELTKLKEMMEAFSDQQSGGPGASIQTLLDGKHLKGDIPKLKGRFYDRLNAHAAGNAAELKKLLQAAPSFKKVPMPPNPPKPNFAGTRADDGRMDHFLDRHTRDFYEMKSSNHADRNSFFPEGMTSGDVSAVLATALSQLPPPGAKRTTKQVVPIPDRGIWVEIAIIKKGPNTPQAPAGLAMNATFVDQLFPIDDATALHKVGATKYNNVVGAPGWTPTTNKVQTFSKADMQAIAASLRLNP